VSAGELRHARGYRGERVWAAGVPELAS